MTHNHSTTDHSSCEADGLTPCETGECIYDFHKCNGIEDCPNGDDEDHLVCDIDPCDDPSLLRCASGGQCFTHAQACDSFGNCNDLSDEVGCHVRCLK